MSQELIFALLSSIIFLIWAYPYIRDVLHWKTIPHLFTYVVWLILMSFNCFVIWNNREWMTLIPSILMWLSVLFWCIYGIPGLRKITINWFDYLCLWSAILLIGYWWMTKNILHTVILTTIVDLIAFLPTFKKWWLQPWTETIFFYFMWAINQILTLFSLSSLGNLENTIFWFYLFFANWIFFLMVAYRRYSLKW